MQVGKLFNLVTDAQDLLAFFERVETKEQLTSRLEHLRRSGSEELLEVIDGLRASVDDLMHDTLEMSASLDDDDDGDEKTPEDAELDRLVDEVSAGETDVEAGSEGGQNQNTPSEIPQQTNKKELATT